MGTSKTRIEFLIHVHICRLTVEAVEERDAGVYQCYATNNVGQTGVAMELVVRNVKPTFAQQMAEKIVYAMTGNKVVSTDVLYVCKFENCLCSDCLAALRPSHHGKRAVGDTTTSSCSLGMAYNWRQMVT
jgi:hypothetical protein